MTTTPIIAFNNVCKTFGTNQVLNGISFKVNQGEDVVILGRSGSGKSVAVKCIVGLIEVDKGEIVVFGTDVTQLNYKALNKIRTRIGFCFKTAHCTIPCLYDRI